MAGCGGPTSRVPDRWSVRRRRSFNLSQDLDFRNVAQDNPQLIVYIQAVHLRQPQSTDEQSNAATEKPRLPPAHSALVAKLLHFKVCLEM
uniref:Uncharacterized protein n=1 Tax=Timema bartmani TaxID=61472 RepID=A0A7R9HVN4_9NEOP|nr:unnamed protein product [Timema bartmani]